jgi:alkylhydroperoxidase/carboxymuconolactone decarboxylase family protein YurZ
LGYHNANPKNKGEIMKHYPPFIKRIEKTDPDLFKVVTESHDLIMEPGVLGTKTKLLITLAVDAFAGSSGVRGIADAARRAGATEAEIIEALRLAYYVAGNKALFTAVAAFNDSQ